MIINFECAYHRDILSRSQREKRCKKNFPSIVSTKCKCKQKRNAKKTSIISNGIINIPDCRRNYPISMKYLCFLFLYYITAHSAIIIIFLGSLKETTNIRRNISLVVPGYSTHSKYAGNWIWNHPIQLPHQPPQTIHHHHHPPSTNHHHYMVITTSTIPA